MLKTQQTYCIPFAQLDPDEQQTNDHELFVTTCNSANGFPKDYFGNNL